MSENDFCSKTFNLKISELDKKGQGSDWLISVLKLLERNADVLNCDDDDESPDDSPDESRVEPPEEKFTPTVTPTVPFEMPGFDEPEEGDTPGDMPLH